MGPLHFFSQLVVGLVATDDLERFIRAQMSSGGIPGLSAAVVRRDELLWTGAFGSADPQKGVAATEHTLFTHASISKTVVGVVAMQLEELGLFELDDDVGALLGYAVRNPRFPNTTVTMRQLMTHTSGASDVYYDSIYAQYAVLGDSPVPMASFCELLFSGHRAGQTFGVHAPGAAYNYSNVGATLAACAAERVAVRAGLLPGGGDFDTLARQRVFATALGVPASRAGFRLADLRASAFVAMPTLVNASAPSGFSDRCHYGYPDYADGLWKARAADYARLLGAVANDGTSSTGAAMLNATTVARMIRPELNTSGAHFPFGAQGLLWYYYDLPAGDSVSCKYCGLLGHSGGDDGVATDAFLDVDSGVGFVVLTNGDWDDPIAGSFSRAMAAIETRLLDTFVPPARQRQRLLSGQGEPPPPPRHHPSRRQGRGGGGRQFCEYGRGGANAAAAAVTVEEMPAPRTNALSATTPT